ncbi:MAG TPA: prepilin peptidase [Myxococcota bacterium]|nr:prepilin peptidase [Myxococcota bacterium]
MVDADPGMMTAMPLWLMKATALIVGACFGSFANVVIHRVPRGLSIVRPGSACPGCGHMIRWYENIPILSWVFLRGRCSSCHMPISVRYPMVELMVAIMSLASLFLALSTGDGLQASPGEIAALWFFPFSLTFLLVCIIFIDLEHWIIPHVLTIIGIALGIARSLLLGDVVGVAWHESLIGAAAGALPIVLIIEVYFRLTGREGMGYGDVMLMAMAGAWFGYIALPFILLAASLQGLIGAIPMLASRNRPVPPWQKQEPPADQAAEKPAEADGAQTKDVDEGADSTPQPPSAAAPVRQMAIPFGPFIALAVFEWLFFQDLILTHIMRF